MMEELDRLLAGFGDWICEQCKTGEHARCAGWGGTRGDHCLCEKQGHDAQKAFDMAYERGIERLDAMQL